MAMAIRRHTPIALSENCVVYCGLQRLLRAFNTACPARRLLN
jgi:hypothetical protein